MLWKDFGKHFRKALHNSLYHREIPVAFLYLNSRCPRQYNENTATEGISALSGKMLFDAREKMSDNCVGKVC